MPREAARQSAVTGDEQVKNSPVRREHRVPLCCFLAELGREVVVARCIKARQMRPTRTSAESRSCAGVMRLRASLSPQVCAARKIESGFVLVPGQYSISGRRGKCLGFDNLSGSRIKQPPCYCPDCLDNDCLASWASR